MGVRGRPLNIAQMVLEGYSDLNDTEVKELTGLLCDMYNDSQNVVTIPDTNVIFVGDLHGEFDCAMAVKRLVDKYHNHHFVFLGDYGDRGPQQTATFNLVAALAIKHADRVLMLRGNHESTSVALRYGFYFEVQRLYNRQLFDHISAAFAELPLSARSKNGVFACHGGVPEGVNCLEDLIAPNRKSDEFDEDIFYQLVWNDPEEGDFRFRPNPRGGRSRIFGEKAFDEFCNQLDIKLLFRAHQVFPEGIKKFFEGRLVSVFSSRYRGRVNPKVARLGKNFQIEELAIQCT
jgi:diadenosine tetraphosphatase ApaH/serine/threonine PP2A family protein phosphatase